MSTTLTDAELARLEELASKANKGPFSFDGNNQVFRGDNAPFAFAYAVGFPTDDNQAANCEYIAAACNALPSFVAEVRALRRHNQVMRSGNKFVRDDLQVENAALRERVEALEWNWEVTNFVDDSIFFLRLEAAKELEATLDAAREAIK